MFKAAGLNAGLIAELSCLCDLPQLASQGHRTHAVCVRVCVCLCDFLMCVCICACFLFVCLCVSTLVALPVYLDVIVCVPFNVCVLMSVYVFA